MRIAGGVLGWSEAEFWSCSMPFFRAALEGRAQMLGVSTRPKATAAQRDAAYRAADAMLAKMAQKE